MGLLCADVNYLYIIGIIYSISTSITGVSTRARARAKLLVYIHDDRANASLVFAARSFIFLPIYEVSVSPGSRLHVHMNE
jgi:hypothetical protein